MKRKTSMKILLAVMGITLGMAAMGRGSLDVRAAEDTPVPQEEENTGEVQTGSETKVAEISQIMTADEAVDMKAAPENSAETILSYQKGDSVFVTGETEDGWYRAIYQDKEGYLPKDSLSTQEIDVAALDEEMARTEQEAELMIETVEKYHAEARRSRIWGSVIVVLVLGIFATGIISGVRGARAKEK